MARKIETEAGVRTHQAGSYRFSLTKCPACGREFTQGRGAQDRWRHIAAHDPEDFGLAPEGKRR